MKHQYLIQTKNAIASSNRESAIARSSTHPIEELQGAIGNQAVNKLLANQPILQAKPMFGGLSHELVVQPKLAIGAVGDKYEQEADRVASQVVEQIRAPASAQLNQGESVQHQTESGEELQAKPSISQLVRSPIIPEVQREEKPEEEELQAKSMVQGGEVTADLDTAINSARGSGQPLDAGLQRSMGQAMGANFSGVKVHTDARADQLNQSVQAKAFTTGKDVFFRQGEYQPGSPGGKELIAHELTHVVQQNGGAVMRSPQAKATTKVPNSKVMTGLIQRDIGFEFETKNMYTKKSNTGTLPGAGFSNSDAAKTVWFSPNSTRVKKGKALLRQADVEVQADDHSHNNSDVEVVTTHFPLTHSGRTRLNTAMLNVNTLITAYTPLMTTTDGIVPAEALNGTAGFNTTMHDGMFFGDFATAKTSPQVTFGTRLENIADIVADLHADPTESNLEKTDRDPGRLHMRGPNPLNNAEPKQLVADDESQTLVTGRGLAQQAIRNYQLAKPLLNLSWGEIEGLLTIVFAYCESMQYKRSFLKNHTPLMAKTDLATIFTTLPNDVQTYFSAKDDTGKSKLEELVESAPGYVVKMNQPLFYGIAPDAAIAEDNHQMGQPQWYHALTLESWLRGIVLRDRTKGEAFKQFFYDNYGASQKRRGTDQLTNQSFPGKPRTQEVEGYGALGKRMDRDVLHPETPLPIFELRSANKKILYSDAQKWALDFFDYIRSLNRSPWGGHTRMS
ncbi:MAG: DUF4157 domain-containing protein [Oscillatoriaceae cyanobacterium Prado104]|jgi:hypothetical protein|nr:DUF4157 domain-containing protein [Oscillatoriaceae cyanobacterium Prado104]